MSRPPRAFVPGLPVHVIHRGNNRQIIFRDELDYRFFWRCLKETSEDQGLAVNAYVFMSNHVHLMLTPPDTHAISKTLHCASRRYSGYFNERHDRTGTLWEGRFRASIIANDFYFLACHRYIDLNPVRAGLVRAPADYPWSSHRSYAHGESNSLITPHNAIEVLGNTGAERQRRYRALFEQPLEAEALETIRNSARSCRAVGQQVHIGRPRKKPSLTPF